MNAGPSLTNGSLGVLAATNRFQYTPGTNTWGPYGGTVTVALVCSDLLGNATTSGWSFALEVLPVVTNDLVHLRPPPSGTPARTRALLATAAERHGVLFSDNLTIVSVASNQVVFSYTGGSHGLFVGAILINHDPAQNFYRRILGLADDPPNQRVTATTVDIPLTEIVEEGSFSPEVFVPPDGAGAAVQWSTELGYSVPFAYQSEFSVLPWDVNERVRITPGVLAIDLRGNVQVACEIRAWQVVVFDASVSSELAASIRARVEFLLAQADLLSASTTLAAVPLGYVVAFIGPVPVWLELQVGVDLGLQVSAETAVTFEFGVDTFSESEFRLDWTSAGWDSSQSFDLEVVPVPLDIGFEVSAEAFLYLKPRLSALLYSLAGVSADYRRGPALEAKYEVGAPQCELTLYDKWTLNAGLTVVGVADGELPNQTLAQEKRVIETWYWPELTNQAPVFTQHPSNVTAAAGSTVVLNASATGNPAPSNQWFQNGIGIPFRTQPTLRFTASPQSAGSYHVAAQNSLGRVTSASATVTVTSPPGPAPSGMVYVQGGTLPDIGNGIISVSTFLIGKYEVTWGEWQTVFAEASARGYDFLTPRFGAEGCAGNHPVQTVTWYDAVKWCNLRSEIEGRTPVYRVDGNVYKSGWHDDVTVNAGANGYRLPTDAEWEFAARRGTQSHGYEYSGGNDLNAVGWYWDNSGGAACNYWDTGRGTWPAGQKAANELGLHDMSGNVWEWCFDWYPGYEGSSRVFRGGGWYDRAFYCRVAFRYYFAPDGSSFSFGFRAVLPPGQ